MSADLPLMESELHLLIGSEWVAKLNNDTQPFKWHFAMSIDGPFIDDRSYDLPIKNGNCPWPCEYI